jgi:hypothetical protein
MPAIARTAKPDDDADIVTRKVDTMTVDISRGPYHAMLDRQALARQSQTGESYAKAFTEVYTDPANSAIRDGAQLDHLSKAHDAMHGTRLSLIPKVEKAAPYDPLRKAAEVAEFLGPAHAKLHSMAVDHQRAHSGMSYQQAYSHITCTAGRKMCRCAMLSRPSTCGQRWRGWLRPRRPTRSKIMSVQVRGLRRLMLNLTSLL